MLGWRRKDADATVGRGPPGGPPEQEIQACQGKCCNAGKRSQAWRMGARRTFVSRRSGVRIPLAPPKNQGLNCGDVDRARFLHATRTTGVPPSSVRNGE